MSKIIPSKDLIEFYKKGFFPMADNASSEKINLYQPKERFIIPIKNFHVPRKLFKLFKKNMYTFKINNDFENVISKCQLAIRRDKGTWINNIILDTYINLHYQKKAHSVECYNQDKLVGVLYGVHIGECFFGESMFSDLTNTSKYCLIVLVNILRENGFRLLDSQFYNKHLIQFGAYEISDAEYQLRLEKYIDYKCEFPKIFNI